MEGFPLWNINTFLICLAKNLSFRLAVVKLGALFKAYFDPHKREGGGGVTFRDRLMDREAEIPF